MNKMDFTFSDTIGGYVVDYNRASDTFTMKTSDSREYAVKFSPSTYAQLPRNLGDGWQDCTGQMRDMLVPGRHLFVYGIFYPETSGVAIESQYLMFSGSQPGAFNFEQSDWWIRQIQSLGEFYMNAQFGGGEIDYKNYRTSITLAGKRTEGAVLQETDTISRLVYGFASAYMLTGDDRFLECAEKGTDYLRDVMRYEDNDKNLVYWAHAAEVDGNKTTKILPSRFGDDYNAIPAYEQIYALAGPIQTYRITGDPRILSDAERTVNLFDEYYLDDDKGGYFSHLDPETFDPRAASLGDNRAKKNWNSVGDHAPAYLINLWLATGEKRYGDMLEYTFDTIAKHFPDYDHSPFVQEKFNEDWSHDYSYKWQQNRGVVGHNLKIAWNLMRMNSLKSKSEYEQLARRICDVMPKIGGDLQRHGWYDVMERTTGKNEKWHRLAFHDRKAWWQQEQGILAYLIMNGVLGDDEYLKQARESQAFYNAFFLDHDNGAVYFNVLANGNPYLLGTERFKGSHSMSGYHSFELAFLSQIYLNLLITKQPLTLHFKPKPDGFKDNLLRVSPDILPPGRIEIGEVTVNGRAHTDFDAKNLTVKLPSTKSDLKVKVRIDPK